MAYDEEGRGIQPEEIPLVLKGSLIEPTFTLHHYHIKNNKTNVDYDSYTRAIEQIIVLKCAPPKKISPYRKGKGPVCIQPSNVPSLRTFSWSQPTLREPTTIVVQSHSTTASVVANTDMSSTSAQTALESSTLVATTTASITPAPSVATATPISHVPEQMTSMLPIASQFTVPKVPAATQERDSSPNSNLSEIPLTSSTSSDIPLPTSPQTSADNSQGHKLHARHTMIAPSSKALGKQRAEDIIDDERPSKKA